MSDVHVALAVAVSGTCDIVPAVHDWLRDKGEVVDARIVSKNDRSLKLKMMRCTFAVRSAGDVPALRTDFGQHVAAVLARGRATDPALDVTWRLSTVSGHRILMMVSKTLYAAHAVLGQHAEGLLGDAHLVGLVTNHRNAQGMDGYAGVPVTHIPVDPRDKTGAERRLLHLIRSQRVNVLVLARYMQVLSPWLCEELEADGVIVINLHHGDAVAYPGARPGRQALDRGSRQVGATVHVATQDLDMGPILAQEFYPLPPAATEKDVARLQWRGGALLAETVWAWLSGRIVVCGATAEII